MDSVDADAPTPPEAPAAKRGGRYGLILGVAAIVIVVDQLLKDWAVGRLSPDPSDPGIHVIGDLRFKLAFNSGMAFSQGEGKGALIGAVSVDPDHEPDRLDCGPTRDRLTYAGREDRIRRCERVTFGEG